MSRDPSADVASIETDEPTRGDQLIDLAKNSRRGRFSLRYLFVATLVASIAFASLRAMGVLDRWQDYYWLFMGVVSFFAPMICLCLAAWFWPRTDGHFRLAALGSLAIGAGFVWSMLVAGIPGPRVLAAVIVGCVMWGLQIASVASVHWSLFRDRIPRRPLPDELPNSKAKPDRDADSESATHMSDAAS